MQSVDTTATFVYNENGLRVQKTVNGVVTKYTLHSKNVVHMTQSSNNLHFFYDAQNKPALVVYNDIPYSYIKNLQGDIVAILDSTGTAVVNYVYDAWGRPISKTGSMAGTLGTVQPFRYRGYVYDEETGLYYLRSRYYNRCCFERLCIHYGNVCRLTYSAINEQIRKNAQKPRFRCSLWVVKNAINCDLRPNSFLFFRCALCSFHYLLIYSYSGGIFMWKECRLWIIDSLVSITLFLLVPILLSLTGLVTISVAPGAALIVLGYGLYIFQCVFSRDMKRGIWALVDLMRNISVTHTFTVQEIQSCHSHFSVSRRVSEQTFAKYFIIRCINDAEHVIDLVTVKQQPLIEHNSYRIKYYPFSKIIVDIAPKS